MLNDYQQPDFFRFGHDSIQLARMATHVQLFYGSNTNQWRGLDIGTGCGIVCFEILQRLPVERRGAWDCLELQAEFMPHFQQNALSAGVLNHVCFVHDDLFRWAHDRKINEYDFIVSNPPYFSNGLMSPYPQRQMCRHWSHKQWQEFITIALRLLSPRGMFIFLTTKERLPMIESTIQCEGCQLATVPVFENRSILVGLITKLNIKTDELLAQLRIFDVIKK